MRSTALICTDILLSKDAPEPDYEYVDPVHVLLKDEDKDEVDSTPSSSPPPTPNSWSTTDSDNVSPGTGPSRPGPAPGAGRTPPPPTDGRPPSDPISLPPMPTCREKRRGPPPPPPPHKPRTSEGVRRRLDRDGYLQCVIMPAVARADSQVNNSSRHRRRHHPGHF